MVVGPLLLTATVTAALTPTSPLIGCNRIRPSLPRVRTQLFESPRRSEEFGPPPSSNASPSLQDTLTYEACADIATEVAKRVSLPFYVPQPIIAAAATLAIETLTSPLISPDLIQRIGDVAVGAGTTDNEFDDVSEEELDDLATELATEINARVDLPVLDEEQEFVVFRLISQATLLVLATSDVIVVEPRTLIEQSIATAQDLLGGMEGRANLAKVLNSRIDFPFLNEEDEQKLLVRALDACSERLEEMLPPELIQTLKGEGQEGMQRTKKFIVDSLNKKVDIIGLDEERERWLIENIVNVVVDALISDTEAELLLMSPEEQKEALIERRAVVQREMDLSRRRFEVEQRNLAAKLERINEKLR